MFVGRSDPANNGLQATLCAFRSCRADVADDIVRSVRVMSGSGAEESAPDEPPSGISHFAKWQSLQTPTCTPAVYVRAIRRRHGRACMRSRHPGLAPYLLRRRACRVLQRRGGTAQGSRRQLTRQGPSESSMAASASSMGPPSTMPTACPTHSDRRACAH